jgi:PhnB protein
MQFMIIVKSGSGCETGKKPSDEVVVAVLNYTQELRRAGVLVELSRLEASSKGARIKSSGGKQLVFDGPFAETKEVIGGYWIIRANSMEEAIQWAKRVPAHQDPGEETEIEIRQFLEVEYFIPSAASHATSKMVSELTRSKTQAP